MIGGAPELFGPLFEHCQEEGLVAGVGAVVTACQRVGIRSQVQRLSKPRRGERRRNRRKKRNRDLPAGAPAEAGSGVIEGAEVPTAVGEPVAPEAREEPVSAKPVRVAAEPPAEPATGAEPAPKKPPRRRAPRTAATEIEAGDGSPNGAVPEPPAPRRRRTARQPAKAQDKLPLDLPQAGA